MHLMKLRMGVITTQVAIVVAVLAALTCTHQTYAVGGQGCARATVETSGPGLHVGAADGMISVAQDAPGEVEEQVPVKEDVEQPDSPAADEALGNAEAEMPAVQAPSDVEQPPTNAPQEPEQPSAEP